MSNIDLTGQKFGRLTVIDRADDYVPPSGSKRPMWNCLCDCGSLVKIRQSSLINNESKSCGCLQKELLSQRVSKHHDAGTRLYAIWDSMRQRCKDAGANDTLSKPQIGQLVDLLDTYLQ